MITPSSNSTSPAGPINVTGIESLTSPLLLTGGLIFNFRALLLDTSI